MPAVLVLAADGGVLIQQELAAVGISAQHGCVIQRCQTTTVFIVRRSPELQQCLRARSFKRNTTVTQLKYIYHSSVSLVATLQFQFRTKLLALSLNRAPFGVPLLYH